MKAHLAGIVAALALLAGAPAGEAVVPGNYVVVQNFQPDPLVALVAPGGSVTWDSDEPVVHHNLVALNGAFTCHLTNDHTPGELCTATIPGGPGTVIPYRCTLHPFLFGAVTVA